MTHEPFTRLSSLRKGLGSMQYVNVVQLSYSIADRKGAMLIFMPVRIYQRVYPSVIQVQGGPTNTARDWNNKLSRIEIRFFTLMLRLRHIREKLGQTG